LFFELYGPPQCGKTTVMTILCAKKKSSAWIVAPQEGCPDIWAAVGYEPTIALNARTVREAFEMAQMLQGVVEMVVIDSLAGLEADHPGAQTIANDVRRAIQDFNGNVYVVNQDRYPVRPGGSQWLSTTYPAELVLFRRRPALYTWLKATDYWLTWWERPELRGLTEEDSIWMGGRDGRDFMGYCQEAARRTWVLDLVGTAP